MEGLEYIGALPVVREPQSGRAVLRSTPEPLYDTELIPTSAISELTFYSKPYGQSTAYGSLTKGIAETNLRQAGMLPSPQRFDLFGFNMKFQANTAGTPIVVADWEKIMLGALFEFSVGNKVYLQCPLIEVPTGVFTEVSGNTTADTKCIYRNGMGVRSNLLKFSVGKYIVKLKSTESFGVRIAWTSAITATVVIRAMVVAQGVRHNGI